MNRLLTVIVVVAFGSSVVACGTTNEPEVAPPTATGAAQPGARAENEMPEAIRLTLDAQPSPDWTIVNVPGWKNQQGFRLRVPPGWLVKQTQGIDPELPISSCLGPSNAPSSTRAIVVLLMERRQPSNQAHKTISRRGELAAPGSGGGFHHVCTPFKLLRARTSPLVASLHL